MLTKFSAKNYGCIRDVTVEVTPLHALIGPNDSGKSTILNGIRTLAQLAAGPFAGAFDTRLNPAAEAQGNIELTGFSPEGQYSLVSRPGSSLMEMGADAAGRGSQLTPRALNQESQLLRRDLTRGGPDMKRVLSQMSGARLVRFDPDSLRRASGLVPESESTSFIDDRGEGLPGIYQAIQGRGDDAFRELSDRVRNLFPTVRHVRVAALSRNQLEMQVELTDATRVRAEHMSEGLLYFLAFAAIPLLSKTAILLVEEPENGLHPARIADVMTILREMSSRTQVIIATHSPLVINCLNPDEVTVVTRASEDGTKATPIRATPNFEKRSSVYALGELWLSYADGVLEAPLIQGRNRESTSGG